MEGGIFAVDGSTFNLFEKPSSYGKTLYDRKSRYSLNCQIVVMPHNLLIINYGLDHPGSVHDAYAFQGTEMAQNPEALIPEGHWIWADNAYPTRPWCVVCVCVEHAFAALKGRFQSLQELHIRIQSPGDMTYTVHWVQCCIILHNMIIQFEEVLGEESTVEWA
ncbi:hypothetical protein OG21DRAFT_1479735 [Imleria badia]|nr:hypothetical protein OG21DRAFT_1479735 [Imleria badia]